MNMAEIREREIKQVVNNGAVAQCHVFASSEAAACSCALDHSDVGFGEQLVDVGGKP